MFISAFNIGPNINNNLIHILTRLTRDIQKPSESLLGFFGGNLLFLI